LEVKALYFFWRIRI